MNEAMAPSGSAGCMTPAPVAYKETTDPGAAGLAAELYELS